MESKRNTIQRTLILNAVKELNNHATAEQVYEHIVKTHPTISKATVYRNLSQMADAGELLNIGSLNGSVRYDHNCHKHYHFVCGKCEKVFDADIYFNDLNDRVTCLGGFNITGHSLIFTGTCKECV
ncbi:MAG: transcriptional repressor [Clostridiales bacterium]|jgi:Fe2+ or Zn2+ uptake regulation protein|nr:transcriptional repressor [Clostridiales bacterium]